MDARVDQPLAISRLHYPVTALGPGKRAGVWFQGCSIRCTGCVSVDTWDAGDEHPTSVAHVTDWVVSQAPDGLTISGGEPFDQPQALELLLSTIRRISLPLPAGILVYSGYTLKKLRTLHPATLRMVDVLISGPYVESTDRHEPLVGSHNQRITYFNESLEPAFDAFVTESTDSPPFQVQVGTDGVWLIGIPQPGDMEKLTSGLSAMGIELEGASWQT